MNNFVGKKNSPPPNFFFCVLRPQEDAFAKTKISVTKNFHPCVCVDYEMVKVKVTQAS